MHWKKHFDPTQNLESADLDGFERVTLKITGVESADFEGKRKMVVRYDGKSKTAWPVGKVNATCLAAMFGTDTAGWTGKRVTVHAERVEAFGQETDGVRIVGSPDIAKSIRVMYRLGKKQEKRTLERTDGRSVRIGATAEAAPTTDTAPADAATQGG